MFMRKSILKRLFLNWLSQVINILRILAVVISWKEMKYFTYEYKKACNLD